MNSKPWPARILFASVLLTTVIWQASNSIYAAPARDLHHPWLRASDVPGGYTRLDFKTYPKFALEFKSPNGQHCGETQKVPFPKADWRYGAIETLTRRDGAGFLTCGLFLKTVSDAHALHMQNQVSLNQGIKQHQLKLLRVGKIGNETFAAYSSNATSVGYAADFRVGSVDVVTGYVAIKSKHTTVLSANQFIQALEAMETRVS